MHLLHRHFQMAIRVGAGNPYGFVPVLSALCHFDPPQVMVIRKLWLSWMTDILGSRHQALQRCRVAGEVVKLVWEQTKHRMLTCSFARYPEDATSIPALLDFLRLGEQTRWEDYAPGVITLRILPYGERSNDFCLTILPILASTLQPTHPLRSRKISLEAFCQLGFRWLSSQMESVSSVDRAGLLHAVGDPFQSTPDITLRDDQYVFEDKYKPMNGAALLIEFASSDLWRDHLHHSNFVSCEEALSTEQGRESAFTHLKHLAERWPFLSTPAKIISAIECLEALRCPNTVEVVLAFIWASRGMDQPYIDLDGWRLIQRKTLAFYKFRGIGRLKVLSQHITAHRICHFRGQNSQCRVEGVRLPVRTAMGQRKWGCMEDWEGDLRLAQACQRKMLYQLFGCNPTTWEEMLTADSERADRGVDASVGQSGTPGQFVGWACDYP